MCAVTALLFMLQTLKLRESRVRCFAQCYRNIVALFNKDHATEQVV